MCATSCWQERIGEGPCHVEKAEVTLPAIETVETVLGIRSRLGILEPIIEGRQYDTRVTPILQLRRTVFWAESVIDPWEEVPTTAPAPTLPERERGDGRG